MYPVKNYKITCAYGKKGSWKCGYHCGIDLVPADKKDYNIYSPVPAKVHTVGKNHASYGNYVVLKHTDGYFSRYAHLDSIAVKKGQAVNEGTILGIMGNTGNSTGRHLHFEVHKGSSMKYPANTDPTEYLSGALYSLVGGIHTVKIPISRFKIEVWDKPKKTTKIKNYANCGFFGGFKEGGKYFTLPVGHLIADCTYITDLNYKYLQERGKIKGNKVYVDASKCPNGAVSPENKAFGGKFISTLIVRSGRAGILKIKTIKDFMDAGYAVSGVPVIMNGKDVSYKNDVLTQGWTSGSLYNTKHIFVGLKGDEYIYLMGIQTKTGNCIQSSEVYKKLKGQGFTDVIKLDGGGSTVLDVEGKNKFVTSENRQIHNVIMW